MVLDQMKPVFILIETLKVTETLKVSVFLAVSCAYPNGKELTTES